MRAVASNALAGLATFRRDELALARGLRGAATVVLPLVIGRATGHIQHGAYMALGALPAGFASFQGETRSRLIERHPLVTAVAVRFVYGTASPARS